MFVVGGALVVFCAGVLDAPKVKAGVGAVAVAELVVLNMLD